MLKTIAVIIVAAIAGVLLLATTQPDTFRVQRAASIEAPPEEIFALINDFNRWSAWSPWERKDPAMKRSFGPTTSGTGAVYAWDGNSEVGQGQMQITESVPPSRITIKLDFVRPLEAHNTVEFALEPRGEETNVQWSMQGNTSFPGKIIDVFIDMDDMVGKDFENGLANLKAIAEQ
jgi:carbon monoxide dehydrogenase subunit G